MALWGNTDTLPSTPKYIARKARFDSTAVNTTANTLNILSSATGFSTGDAVQYNRNGGTAIGGLTDLSTYTVRVVGAGLIELYDTYDHAVDIESTTGRLDITSAGVGIHTLQRTGAANGFSGSDNGGSKIIYVDLTEASLETNKSRGIRSPGWWLYRTYTDSNGETRYKSECLVAISATAVAAGDQSDDSIAADAVYVITIDTQPDPTAYYADEAITLSVSASVTSGGGTLSYQWQSKPAGTTRWVNVSGATSADYTTPVLVEANDGDLYRVKIKSANGAKEVTSDIATMIYD